MFCCLSISQLENYVKNLMNMYKLTKTERSNVNFERNSIVETVVDLPSDWEDLN